ncbi:AI-2E family transporter [Clostridium sp. E02]|uniref:AI-2E family transporter n=1 Tax=Clostridium sp. E02 TaxID=2487134 RepID=UPI000F52C020|nr:AI-2E family transporter [Clostridium sp. E02]
MELNDRTIKKIYGLIAFAVLAAVIGFNYRILLVLILRLIGYTTPFLLGAVIAFVLNVPMRRIEKLLPVKEKNRFRRPLSLFLTFLFVIGILLVVIFVVLPELFATILSLQNSFPVFFTQMKDGAENLFYRYPEIANQIGQIQIDWKSVMEHILEFLSNGAGNVISSTVSAALSMISGVMTFGIAVVFAIYILLQKEILSRQCNKLMRAFLPDKVNARTLEILQLTSHTFSSFLAGQCMEAVILGSMFFVTLWIFRLPYALLIGVLIAFTALIPLFGAFIGCAIGAFLMLMVTPFDALLFLILFFVLQQLEGNFIYPHVVGNSVGLPSIWVLVAVTLGGSAMGIVGMLIFIPLSSVFYSLLRQTVNRRLLQKKNRNHS